MRTRIIAFIFAISVLLCSVAFTLTVGADDNATIIGESDIPLLLKYDEEALMSGENSPMASPTTGGSDVGWERWSLPIGNGYFGANVFGRTETERIQISEKTLMNPATLNIGGVKYTVGGLNSFSETYIDFGHKFSEVTDYSRSLDLKTAISEVEYTIGGVKYTREYFTSYPDKALVIRLDADKTGELDFTLRPTVPYIQSYGAVSGDGVTKTGSVTASAEGNVGYIELSGKMGYYDIDFLGLYRIYTDGGTVSATKTTHKYTDTDGSEKSHTDGTITVSGADSAYIIVTLGTDYELTSDIFTSPDSAKPTEATDLSYTRSKVSGYMSAILSKISGKDFEAAYNTLRDSHVADHSELFGRVSLDLGCNSADFDLTTDALLTKYKNGTKSTYLEALLFQYGRYLLIASSREGALPAHLQGAWNTYNIPPWSCGYWHNINVQMNYWPAFSTNIAETFQAYIDYNAAYMEQAKKNADSVINSYAPDKSGEDGGNGWVIGTDGYQFKITSDRSAGNLGFTTQLFWEYYCYTKDPEVLNAVYQILIDAARYITKCVESDADGNYLISHCDSPEMYVNGVWYYTKGTTYAQSFAYLNNYNALLAAKELGIDNSDVTYRDYEILSTVLEQIDKYDPINVGLSGQIKEFREEDFYGSLGDEYNHRHTSQLVGLYPGNIINANTPAWLDAARVTLNERGDSGTAWGVAHKLNLWARIKDGDRAHTLLSTLLKEDIAENLWALHPPFQIDGNFGVTAGISEMLLQSHEGYIAPLAAIPSAWANGSYTGLVARGNFTVSAAWENGVAKTFNITSGKGGTALVYYPAIAGARVVTKSGEVVNFTPDGNNLISFDTVAGETYIISGFAAVSTSNGPTSLSSSRLSSGAYSLEWSGVSGASSYNVYVAIGNASTYTKVGSTTSTSFIYTPSAENENARITFAVTALNGANVETERALAYNNEPLSTEYGVIPAEKVGYPYSVFAKGIGDNEYSYVGSYTTFLSAMNCAKDNLHPKTGKNKGGQVVVYMTGDCKASGDSFNNGSQLDGTVIIDLGGNKLTSGVNRLIGFEAKSVDGYINHTSRVEIRNGSLLTLTKPIAELFSASGFTYSGTKKFELLFDNVTFSKAPVTASGVSILNSRGNFTSTKLATLKAEFRNCTFDYSSQTSALTLINCSAGGEYAKCDIKVSGGTVRASSLDTVTVFSGSVNDSFEYTADASGKFTDFVISGGVAPIITEYGTIPAASLTSDKVFAVFKKGPNDDSYVFHATFGSLLAGALNNSRDLIKRDSGAYAGGTVVIYMFRDYVYQANGTDNGSFNRAFMMDGTLVLDLGGNKITGKRGRLIGFETGSNDIIGTAESYESNVILKNGTIHSSNPAAEVFAGTSTYTGNKTCSLSFEGITFTSDASSVSIVNTRGTFASGQSVAMSLSFVDCVFEFPTQASVCVFSDSTAAAYADCDMTVKGCSFNLKSADALTVISTSDSGDSLTFEDYESAHTILTLPISAETPQLSFNNASLVFVKVNENLTSKTYKLMSSQYKDFDFVPKMSVSFAEELTVNVYIPKENLVRFSFAGTEYTELSAISDKLVTVNGKQYYKFSVEKAPDDCLGGLALETVVSMNGHTLTGSFTFTIEKYAKEVLSSGSEIEKRLIRDTLSYIRAAYAYFNPADTTAKATIDGIIGERYDELSLPESNGSQAVTPGLSYATFTLAAAPSVRFYIPCEADASDYSFKVGGKDVSFTSGTDTFGKYIAIKLSAYTLCEEITYKAGSSEGSYSIGSYLAWTRSENNEKLTAIVERLIRYSQTASDYKGSVSVVINYVDESGAPLADAKTHRTASGESLTLLSPAISGYYTRDLFVTASPDTDTVINVLYKKIPTSVNSETAKDKLSDMVAWGDSITIGAHSEKTDVATEHGIDLVSLGSTASGGSYPSVLQNLIRKYVFNGFEIANCGVGGETSATIASRADTETYYLYLDGEVTIDSSTVQIPLTHYASCGRIGILRQGGKPTVNPVTIVGLDKNGNEISATGTLDRTLTDDAPAGTNAATCDYKYLKYTFTRTDGNTDSLTFASGARVLTASSYLYDGRSCIIFMGENGGYANVAELISQQEEILAACADPELYLIISTHSGTSASRAELEAAMTERWSKNYINMGTMLNTREALSLAGFSEAAIVSAEDALIEGSVSPLLVYDNCHPNAVGYAVIGNIIFQRLFELRAFDSIFDYYDSLGS